jgi:hypothetical protein
VAYNFVTVTGKYTDELGNPMTGTVDFVPSAPIVDSVAKVTLCPATKNIQLSSTGQFSVSILAMDNSGLSAFTWGFYPTLANVPPDVQWLSVLFSNGATQDIVSLPSAPSPFG